MRCYILIIILGSILFSLFQSESRKDSLVASFVTSKPTNILLPNSGTFTDSRDGQVYTWKQMNDGKKWMLDNLNFKTYESYCYDNKTSNCEKHGRLYTWQATEQACPEGWHIPSDGEWKILANAFGGYYDGILSEDIGDSRKAYQNLIRGGNSAFSAQLGGGRLSTEKYSHLYSYGSYWSSTEFEKYLVVHYSFLKANEKFDRNYSGKDWARSCRCLKD